MIIVILGPTGVGKTKLSVELAKKLDAEIINADSMQVYKGLDIGTAKILEEEKENIPHHLFDICDVYTNYTIYDYQKDCRNKIEEIKNRNKNIILVGGSALYIKAALYDYNFKEEENTYNFDNLTNQELLNKVLEYDANTEVHLNNRKRLERTLTKFMNNNTTSNNGNICLYDAIILGLTTNRDNLYQIIDKRVENMVKNGLIEEAKELYDKNIFTKAINTGIGYKELYKYFSKELSLEESINLIKQNSRHYAKRQYTFFNNKFEVNWFNTNYNNFNETILEVYNFITEKKKG